MIDPGWEKHVKALKMEGVGSYCSWEVVDMAPVQSCLPCLLVSGACLIFIHDLIREQFPNRSLIREQFWI